MTNNKAHIFDKLQLILSQLKSDLEKKGLKLENLPEEEVAQLIKEYVPDELMLSSLEIIAQDGEYSLTPLCVALPEKQDHSELFNLLQINPDDKGAIIKTLPMVAYFLGRVFCYGQPSLLKKELSTNDLNLTSTLSEPVFNLQGISRIEKILNELILGNFDISLNGAFGAICSHAATPQEPDPISFAIDVSLRLNNLIDGHRTFIKFIAVSTSFQYEILDGEYVFYNNECTSNADFKLSINGLSELKYVFVKEGAHSSALDVLDLEQFTMTGFLGQSNEDVSLRKQDCQAKIAHTFIKQVELTINELHTESALQILKDYTENIVSKAPDKSREKAPAVSSPVFFDLDNYQGLPS
ncbi:hypothetical protein MUB04_15455 [Acinetobacter indicus]|uniref:hypothetical protein n=1 Tax=Acinetobacter TaxID=469 RepID=UPI0015D24BD2|nr:MULTISPECIES: hypothetical protein [Acinetobacter]MCP0917933.1 hypothetical protein [Acinetobacter indicus]